MSDITQAQTPAADDYYSPSVFANERRKIFRKTWWPVARVEDLPQTGSTLAVDIDGEPVLLVRQTNGELTALSRVCRHRAGLVGETSRACVTRLSCKYHGWTYDLSGQLMTAPEFEGVLNFNKKDVQLPAFKLETWGGFVFVSLNDNVPELKVWLGEMIPEVVRQNYHLDRYRKVVVREYLVKCNWKVYVDNYLEGYHIPTAHPSLFKELSYPEYEVRTRRYHSFQYAPIKAAKDSARVYGHQHQAQETLYYWLFPHFMLNIYPDNMSANYVIPLEPELTKTVFEWYLPANEAGNPPTLNPEEQDKLAAFSHQVQLEDIEICEAVQRNLHSQTYTNGRYSVKREQGVFHFHQLIKEFSES